MYKLYDFPPSGNCYKIRLLLNQMDAPYERVNIDILQQQSRTAEFLQLNPNGKVPVLQHDGRYLAESNAILFYLAKDSEFLPSDSFTQALILQWLFFEQFSHEPYIAKSRYWISILHAEEQYRELLAAMKPLGDKALNIMEAHLAQHTYFVANQYSIVDIALYAYTHVAEEGGYNLLLYPNIQNWFKRIVSQQAHIRINESPNES